MWFQLGESGWQGLERRIEASRRAVEAKEREVPSQLPLAVDEGDHRVGAVRVEILQPAQDELSLQIGAARQGPVLGPLSGLSRSSPGEFGAS